jgi:hypothetical protein
VFFEEKTEKSVQYQNHFGTRHLHGDRHSPVKPLTATNLMALEICG